MNCIIKFSILTNFIIYLNYTELINDKLLIHFNLNYNLIIFSYNFSSLIISHKIIVEIE